VVLEDLVSAQNLANDDWNECPAHEVDALVSNETLRPREKCSNFTRNIKFGGWDAFHTVFREEENVF
jgi:hypothetical protein